MVSLLEILRKVLKLFLDFTQTPLPGSCRFGTLAATSMASYFDEHDCEPTDPEEQYHQNALLELAR